MTEHASNGRDSLESSETRVILESGASLLAARPFAEVSLADVSVATHMSLAHVERHFEDMHALGTAMLDHERSAMRSMQAKVKGDPSAPLTDLRDAFRSVGQLLAEDVVVRAGVKLAAESRHHFPERRLDPFRTWQNFVDERLRRAHELGQLHDTADIEAIVRLIVAGGMGTKDLLAVHGTWSEAESRFDEMISAVLKLISAPSA
ncbi:DNA-binding transcriptional regulator, AcrR family [Microbacterium azadirachtae]|uniref:DNA-binding transcriptional regulator, AcrR family n=1 Tax=Microbacterium azadirachtae TaxID=582680 RepID=A0A1I6FV56_9MICO|nr:TetR/AcrR family transcriptional regulator [Microbacterium azadirachtae]SFR33819.1 DNA-binding transcriptional regulator, AcrR family [Microbacterium azadirachtae]